MNRLPLLDERIDARVTAIRAAHSSWPCAKGCDACCRSLPSLPVITRAEWERLRDALATWSEAEHAQLVAAARAATVAPVTCPILGPDGACRAYAARPIACRTHGYYTERDAGLHCEQVTGAAVGREVVWGNGEAIAADMRPFGEVRPLLEWLEG